MEHTIYNLRLHEELYLIKAGCVVIRVPGGWIYQNWDFDNKYLIDSTFVPYNNEFKKELYK